MTLKTNWGLDDIVYPNHMNDICRNINENTNKLDGIDNNANNYTHPDKHPASIIQETENKRFVSDSEKSKWNNKSEPGHKHSMNDIERLELSSLSVTRPNGKTVEESLLSNERSVLENTTKIESIEEQVGKAKETLIASTQAISKLL